MMYDEIIRGATVAAENRQYDQASALALIAIADRLDRLCEISSQRNKHF